MSHCPGRGKQEWRRASDQWSKKPCETNKESLTHPTPNFLSFILGNGSSPKCWGAQASLHCSAGGPGTGPQTLPSPEHPPPMPQRKAHRFPANIPPAFLNARKIRTEDFAHFTLKNEAATWICCPSAHGAFARTKPWRNLREKP